jgi:hypothetical protein
LLERAKAKALAYLDAKAKATTKATTTAEGNHNDKADPYGMTNKKTGKSKSNCKGESTKLWQE